MFRYFSIFLIVFVSSAALAQRNLSNSLKFRIHDRTLGQKFTILVQGNVSKLKKNPSNLNYTFNYSAGDVASVTLDLNSLSKLIEDKTVIYAEFIEANKKVMNDTMVVRNRIKPVKNGQAPLAQAYDGTGVVVGIIDTGTDWRHEDFKDALGNTRIQFFWDQNPPNGPTAPAPFNYGNEWTAAQINASLCPHDDIAGSSHGTHVSGIAAGNGLATGKFEGCAPKADLVVVALNFNLAGPTIADAVKYIFTKATLLGKPCIINASLGDYYGSHDGTDLEGKIIENMVKFIPGRVMVAAAGNAGVARYHARTIPPVNDTSFTWLTNGQSSLYYWLYADTMQISNVQIDIGANRTNYFNLGSIGFKNYNYALGTLKIDTLKNNGNRIGVVKTSASVNSYGVYELSVRIDADTLNLLWRIESKGNGLHDAWNFDLVGSGLPTVGQYSRMAKYVMPDTLFTIVSGFQCSDHITTVANYNNLGNYYDYNNVIQPVNFPGGAKVPSSSLGPTRDGRVKPDIAATGDAVFAALCVGLQGPYVSGIPQYVAPGGKHIVGSGTSASSPVVAGLGALFLQAYPFVTSLQFKNAVNTCAYQDNFTGNSLPNDAWGHGKLDGMAAMQCIITSVKEISVDNNTVNFYPNPFKDKINIKFNSEVNGDIFIYNVEGKMIFTDNISTTNYELRAAELNCEEGLLFVKIITPLNNMNFKLILEK